MHHLYLILVLLIAGCQQENFNGFKITIKSGTSPKLYLYDLSTKQPVKADSSSLTDGSYSFEINIQKSTLYLAGENPEKSILFIANPHSSASFIINNDDPINVSVTGDSSNIILQNHFKYRNNIINQLQKIGNEVNESSMNQKNQLQAEYEKYLKKLINKNINSPAILMTLWEIKNPVNYKKELLIIKNVIEKFYKNQDYLTDINNVINSISQQEQLLQKQKLRKEQEENQKKILGLEIGLKTPDIALKNPEGEIIKLSSLKGNVVLLDFWASWCRPCRAENPKVVNLYTKYKSKGFTVYSVSLDQNKDQWTNAIKQDNLIWKNHVSELSGWKSSAGAKYGVTSIPKTFLIDREGTLIGFNLRAEQLENKLKEIL